jgi:hypothetical protein
MHKQTTKERAGRITNRDYFHQSKWLTANMYWLALVGVLTALGGLFTVLLIWWAVAVVITGRQAGPVSPGPIASVHATWENRCDSCHQPFSNIHLADRCDTCHGGPLHFQGQLNYQQASRQNCAECHTDHRGRGFSLAQVSDEACTKCHANLKPEHKFASRITAFLENHPENSISLKSFDPEKHRRIKFDHALHMSAGLVREPSNPRAFRLSNIKDPVDKQRYKDLQRSNDNTDLVQLDCRACHLLDAGDAYPNSDDSGNKSLFIGRLPKRDLPSRVAGGNPLPVNYNQHCRACHPMASIGDQTAPHGIQPGALREFVKGVYSAKLLAGESIAGAPVIRDVRRLDRPEPPQVIEARAALQNAMDETRRHFDMSNDGCTKCHVYSSDDASFFDRVVQSPPARDVWYEHARFTHVPHRAVQCIECHPVEYPQSKEAETNQAQASQSQRIHMEQALVPEVKVCMRCHAEAKEEKDKLSGGASAHCVECHWYHNGSNQGIGAAVRIQERAISSGD